MSVTLEDIAKAAGVSVSTVSRALHNTQYAISEETRERITHLAKEMGYSPNLSARGLRGKSTLIVGIVVENISDPFASQIVRGVIDQLKLTGYSGIIINTDYDPFSEKEAVATLVSNRTDGIIFIHASLHSYEHIFEEVVNTQPFVIVNRIQPPGDNTIGLDDYYGSQLATNHLLMLDYKKIAFINGPESWWTSRERLAGYLDALSLRGRLRNAEYIKHGDWEVESGWKATQELLALPVLPDAIFAANDLMALGALYAVQDAGLHIPHDVAIIGHDDREFTRIVHPALSTVRMPCYEFGHAAVQMLLKRLETGKSVQSSLIRGEIIVRDSCGASQLMPSISRSETQVGRDAVVLKRSSKRNARPLSVPDVRVKEGFWGQRQELNHKIIIPTLYKRLEAKGNIEAIKLSWKLGQPDPPDPPAIFNDGELTQWMEAVSYILAVQPDTDLQDLLSSLIDLFVQAQQPDGYLNSYYAVVEPRGRFTNLRDNQELRSARHLIDAALAHHQATGEYMFLNVSLRFADLISTVFGSGEHQKHGYPGYQGIELTLVNLYRFGGDRRYLEVASYFVNQRGQQPHYFDEEARYRGENPDDFQHKSYEYNQSHLPVREQTEAIGHAARAVLLYAAMIDLGIELEDESLIHKVEDLYESVCHRRMYITGGIGSSSENDSFTYEYDLPNENTSASTEAAVGLWLWMHSMLHINCDGQYADVMERVLYNGILSSISLDGLRYFMKNQLKVDRERRPSYHREQGHTSLSPILSVSNLFASLGQYIYSQGESEIIVHHYIQSSGKFDLAGYSVVVHQETDYPWDGEIAIELELDTPQEFTLKLRIPGWCQRYSLQVNDHITDDGQYQRGYIELHRQWQHGDKILLNLDMPVERNYAHPKVTINHGRVALQRGPIVYCLESVDNNPNLDAIVLPRDAHFQINFDPDLLGGIVTIHADALYEESTNMDDGQGVFFNNPPSFRPCVLKAVPYFSWDNRESGNMLVWIREATWHIEHPSSAASSTLPQNSGKGE